MDILRMLDELHELAVDAPRSFGPIAFGLNKDEISMNIAKIRASLPTELKQASAKVQESERMMDTAREDATVTLENAKKEAERIHAEAQRDAARIIEQAKLEQTRMVDESEILKISKAMAEEHRNRAEQDAVQLRRQADAYAHEVLSKLEGVLHKAVQAVEKGKQEVTPRAEPLPSRERTRV